MTLGVINLVVGIFCAMVGFVALRSSLRLYKAPKPPNGANAVRAASCVWMMAYFIWSLLILASTVLELVRQPELALVLRIPDRLILSVPTAIILLIVFPNLQHKPESIDPTPKIGPVKQHKNLT